MKQQSGSVQREIVIALAVVALSVLLLPGMIYLVGSRIFGPYSSDRIADIYVATLGDLMVPRMAAWLLLLTPMVCVVLLRMLFGRDQAEPAAPDATPSSRREPSVNG